MKATVKLCGLLLAALLLLPGCVDRKINSKTDRIKVLQGTEQCALPGEVFSRELRAEVLGASSKNFFGGTSSPKPLAGRKVRAEVLPGSSLEISPATAVSDIAGTVSFQVKAGAGTGDHYLRLIPEDAPEKAQTIRYVTGLKISGADQVASSLNVTAEPVSVQLVRADGKPAAGVPVYFSVQSSPDPAKPAKVTKASVKTDASGVASTEVRVGAGTGENRIAVEVADPAHGYFIRSNSVRLLSLDLTSVILAVVGGLAFFIFGMKLMGDGLLKVSGENMKRILQFFSRNRVVAILAGTVVTAIIQSSSATTVMVIGFINAGLLTLKQSIGIIFGANIGTTVTAQIIALNLSGLALPSIAVGFVIMLSGKRVIKGWGETILGFGLLFFGMTMMSDELKTLGTFPMFIEFFRTFDCAPVFSGGWMPFGAILGAIAIGTVATFVIQSSSAAMGIILALAAGGLINFYTAIPLLIGTNIGTTITSFIAALAANRVAKQAALAHLLFNLVGTSIMLALFYVPYGPNRIPCFLYFINAITPGDAFAAIPQGIERHIAMAHTMFNVITVLLLMPLIGLFTRLCERILPVKGGEELKTLSLEPLLLATPAVAIDQVIAELRKMVVDAWDMVDHAVNEHFISGTVDADKFALLRESEKKIDDTQLAITNYLVQITRRELTQHQSGIIPLLMHCTNDAERIADHTENILKLTKRLDKTGVKLSDIAVKDLRKMWDLLNSQSDNVTLALGSATNKASIESALESERRINKLAKKYQKTFTRKKEAVSLRDEVKEEELDTPYLESAENSMTSLAMENEREINQLAKQCEKEHVDRRNRGQCSVEASVIFVEVIWELERIGDHLANIAVRTPEIQKHYFSL